MYVFIALGIFLGCTLVSQSPVTTLPPRVWTSTPPAPATATQPASAPSTPTDAPNPCPAWHDMPIPARPPEFEAYVTVLETYLTEGGNPLHIPHILTQWEASPVMGIPWMQKDVTGDGAAEIIISFVDPASELYPPISKMAVYGCRDGGVIAMYIFEPGEWFGLNFIGAQDLTLDGVAELVFSEVSCGAHTCWDILHVWAWSGTDFEEKVGREFTTPYATYSLEEHQILISSHGIGSVGAGPQRPVTTTLTWNGEVVTATAMTVAPAVFRYHVFRDGDTALLAGDLAAARMAYQRVLKDDRLENWSAYTGTDEERLWFDALARWRLLTLEVYAGNMESAEVFYTMLLEAAPADMAGAPVTELARQFWQAYQAQGNLPGACRAALDIQAAQDTLYFLNGFGYANPTYALEDLCPFLSP